MTAGRSRLLLTWLALFTLLVQFLIVAPGNAAPAPEGARVIVALDRSIPAGEAAALHASMNARVLREIPALGLHIVQGPAHMDAAEVARGYARNPWVRFAEPDALVAPALIPDDPQYGSQWHHGDMGTPPAWDYNTGTGILIGICDTGVEAAHPDLAANLRADLGINIVDGTTNWADDFGHGTAVAGVAAAAGNNGLGVAGVAYGASIIPVRITNMADGTAYVSDAANCIQYAADHGARAINLSYRMAGYSTIDTAAQYAENLGAVVTVSAGNEGINPGYYPFPSFLAVAATDSNRGVASFSSYGAHVDLAAPGVNVYTTGTGGTYGSRNGTSFSAPAVAGVAALLFAADPAMTPVRAKDLLIATAADIGAPGRDDYAGYGLVDARRAVGRAVNGIDGRISTGSLYVTSPTVLVASTVVDDSGTGVTEMRFSEDDITYGPWEPYASLKPYTLTAGDGIKTLAAQFKNGAGGVSVSARTVVLLDTTAPTGSVSINAGAAATNSNVLTLNLNATDATSGVSNVRASDDGVTWGEWGPYATAVSYLAPEGDGVKTVYVQFRDGAGNLSEVYSDSILVDTVAPTGTVLINDGAEYTNKQQVVLSMTASDEGTGVTEMRFSRDGTYWGGWYAFAPTYNWTVYTQGIDTTYVQFRDAAGNISETTSDGIFYDIYMPSNTSIVINSGAEYTQVPQVTLTLNATDDGSGVAEMRLNPTYTDNTVWGPWEPYVTTREYTLTAEGTSYVRVQFRDRAGNTVERYDSIKWDQTPPSGSLMIGNGNPAFVTSTSVSLYLYYGDGISYRLSNDGTTWTEWAAVTPYALPWTLLPGDGLKTVYAQYQDRAGNVAQYSDVTYLDTTGPVVTGVTPADGSQVTGLNSVTFTMSDDGSGVDPYATCPATVTKNGVALTGSSCNYTVANQVTVTLPTTDNRDGVYTFTITPEDEMGNLGTPTTVTITSVPATPPTPTNLTATVSGSSVSLSWVDNATFETSFVVERALKTKTGTGPYSVIATVASPNTAGRGFTVQYTDSGLAANTYVYRVKAVGPDKSSDYSAAVQARVR